MQSRYGLILLAIMSSFVLSACSLPRGAPVKSEVIGSNGLPEDVVVEEVSRANVEEIASWSTAGWHGHFHWFERVEGPGSRIIRPGDYVVLTVWDNQDNSLLLAPGSRSVQVQPAEVSTSGSIFVPYVDEVSVGGLTSGQARKLIQQELSPIAPSAQVQIEVKPGSNNSVDLVSGVGAPGTVELSGRNVSLLTAISKAGGVDKGIKNPVVRLIRDGRRYEMPAKSLFENPKYNVILRGGDQIIVVEDERFFVGLGSTENERLIYFDREKISALDSVSMLGGLVDARANPQGLLILRQYPSSAVKPDRSGPGSEYVVFSFNLASADGLFGARNFQIQPHDVVMATESAVKPAQAVIALMGSLFAINNVF